MRTAEELSKFLSAYDDFKKDVLSIAKRIRHHEDAEDIDYIETDLSDGYLIVGYTSYCRGYENYGSVDIPLEIVLTDAGEDRDSKISKYNVDIEAKDLEEKQAAEIAKEMTEKAEYERLKEKYGN